jgi:hypothetical protein
MTSAATNQSAFLNVGDARFLEDGARPTSAAGNYTKEN